MFLILHVLQFPLKCDFSKFYCPVEAVFSFSSPKLDSSQREHTPPRRTGRYRCCHLANVDRTWWCYRCPSVKVPQIKIHESRFENKWSKHLISLSEGCQLRRLASHPCRGLLHFENQLSTTTDIVLSSARDLGVVTDSRLTMADQVVSVYRSAYRRLRQIRSTLW